MTDQDPTPAEQACFEAGIKFGALYHQFAGTPVSPESAESLGRAMEQAIENQPFCRTVSVEMRTDRIQAAIEDQPAPTADYTELTGEFMDVDIHVERDSVQVHAVMQLEDSYPRMRLATVDR